MPTWLYRAADADRLPTHILLHGGAFTCRSAGQVDRLAREYAQTVGCLVAVPHYRLAPEHPWPAAVDDTRAVLRWLAAHTGTDPARISIGGISAGACIATQTALLAREPGDPAPMFQLLEVPIVDFTQSSPSVARYGTGYLASRKLMADGVCSYVPDVEQRRAASPLFADDLSGQPPAFVITAAYDPLRDEGEAYARRLREAGVPVEAVRARNHIHTSIYSVMPSGQRYRALAAAALARAYRS